MEKINYNLNWLMLSSCSGSAFPLGRLMIVHLPFAAEMGMFMIAI